MTQLLHNNNIQNNSATKTTLTAKINEVKGEIPNITNFPTTSSLTAVENKITSASNLVKKTDYKTYQCGLPTMVYKFFDKKTSGSGIKYENISNKEFAIELHKPVIKNFNNRKLHSPFIDNIWGADLADMQLVRNFTQGFRFSLCYWHLY